MSYSRSPLSRPAHSASDDSAYRSGAPVALAAVLLLLLGILSPLGSAGGARADESAPATPSAGASQSSSNTDYDTWSAVATAVSSDLDEALTQYQSGNTAGAAATFQKAYSISYSASNMGNVVESTIGQDTATAQQQAFTDLRTQAYATGNDAAIAAAVASLKTSLTDSATTLDATGSLASPRDYAAAQAATIATERAEIEANRKDVNEGRQGRTWTEVAGEMTPLIDQAVDKATGGDGRAGADLVNKAYYGYYEKLGFEKTVMAAISGNRVSQVENQFKVVRQAMINGADDSEVTADAESLKSMLTEDAAILDGGAAASVNPIKAFLTGSFGQAFIILLREGLEAILVVVAIIAVPVVLSRSGAGHILGGATAGGGGGVTLAADAPIDSALTVTGRIGSTPALSLKGVLAPPAPEQVITDVVVQGTGRTVNEGDGVLLSVSRFSGTDGANTTGSPSGRRLFFRRLDAGVVGEAIDAAVVQAAEGSRIVLRSSVESSGGRVAEVTVVDVLPTLAAGAAQTPAAGTPSVALAEDGTVSVGLTGLAAPTRSTAAVVIRGEGSQVSATDTIVARYTIVSWSGGTVRTTSYGWTTAPGTIDMTNTLAGLTQGLVDVPVGSRVVLSLPADQARGDEPVAVVVDVLAIVEGGAAPSDAASAPATP